MERKLKLLFLCTGNSCRSQMAEGWTRALKGDLIEVCSAGIETHGLNRTAVEVMAEAGVDISGHTSKHVDDLKSITFDAVITVCDQARETCPFFPGAKKVLHVGFSDPPALARELAAEGADEKAQRDCYRRVRDEIRAFVETLPESLHIDPSCHTSC
ncbi:MAG: arsenate reductase ArsC [Desulfobulbaceae bacterium]|nr:MAG: arsenate reductase ArsC [Desulfobulbaceae bacterium]